MDTNEDNYSAFLLRFWREADGSLRATVHDPHSGEQAAFASQEALLAFVTERLCEQASEIDGAD